MDRNTFYPEILNITFSNLPVFWKAMVVIGSISTIIFLILLLIIVSLMFETKLAPKKEHQDLSEYDDFLNEFASGKKDSGPELEVFSEYDKYPSLPKIKDFDGNILKNLMQIDII